MCLCQPQGSGTACKTLPRFANKIHTEMFIKFITLFTGLLEMNDHVSVLVLCTKSLLYYNLYIFVGPVKKKSGPVNFLCANFRYCPEHCINN